MLSRRVVHFLGLRPHMQAISCPAPSGARTTTTRARLARLPIPDMHQTLQRYLVSLEPLLQDDEARGVTKRDDALALRERWAQDFEHGLGRVCQERLRALDSVSPNNWLDDNIWLKKAYHEWRAPLIVNSNWWLSFKNDTTVPLEVVLGTARDGDVGGTGITRWQIRRAAWLTYRLLDFNAQLQRQEIYPDSTKLGIWFRQSVDRIFNVCRIPQPICDIFSSAPPPSSLSARTVTLCVHDWFYTLDVLDSAMNPLPPRTLESMLHGVVSDVAQRLERGEVATPISVLTTDDRDQWSKNYQHLLNLSPRNHENVTAIHHSIIGLSLDHYTYTLPSTHRTHDSPLPPPDTPEEVDAHLHNIRSGRSAHPGRNRWFDKPLTLIVESNSRAGAMGEHSPVDALVPSVICDYAVVQEMYDDAFGGPLPSTSAVETTVDVASRWRRLDWVVDDYIRLECVEAEDRARKIVEDSDDSVLWFDAYGAEWIKQKGLSPDAYIQMALQLAWYRTRRCFTATYETALARLFQNGRTETIRSLTADSRAWVLAMEDPSASTQTQYALLRAALKTHNGLTRAASTGRGIDRHLLGLRCMLQPGERHELFEDELFSRSQTWKLSTSGLSAGIQFRGTGFGAPEHDGYGVNYTAGPEAVKFGIESKHSCPETSTQVFKDALQHALLDMRALCVGTAQAHL